eukprot:CAMPEP_0168454246 /NCGR_PEP_ID=MMETSP0228-20121227/50118_1 /TAXON_ID=133427 /ORGANISM="Protoceratium reticulatum, Strain CCCM 535 (=CCMP 1889)" /LENGTH=137 /DNA_ID=CAMNT_0008469019 /DNA_START=21 /DNA_END=435 /DNA_ORIENTATION=+
MTTNGRSGDAIVQPGQAWNRVMARFLNSSDVMVPSASGSSVETTYLGTMAFSSLFFTSGSNVVQCVKISLDTASMHLRCSPPSSFPLPSLSSSFQASSTPVSSPAAILSMVAVKTLESPPPMAARVEGARFDITAFA